MDRTQLGEALAPDASSADRTRIVDAITAERRSAYARLAGIGDALSVGSSVADLTRALVPWIHAIERVGSRVTCDPAPVDTDEDWLVLLAPFERTTENPFEEHPAVAILRANGFAQDGSPDFYTGSDAGGFRSWRRGDVNVVTTEETEFHGLFLTATAMAKRLNLLRKADRISLFQCVLYGVRAEMLENPSFGDPGPDAVANAAPATA